MKRYIIISVLLCLMLTGCTFLADAVENATKTDRIKQGDFTVNIRMKKAYAAEYDWDGNEQNTDIYIPAEITLPDSGETKTITEIGGIYGSGMPMPFRVTYGGDVAYGVKAGAEVKDIVFNLHIGADICDVNTGMLYMAVPSDSDTVYYRPSFYIECAADNPYMYSKDGKLYKRGDDSLFGDIDYWDEAEITEETDVSDSAGTSAVLPAAPATDGNDTLTDTVTETSVTQESTDSSADTSVQDMPAAYRELLLLYLYVQDSKLDNLETSEAGLDSSLSAFGWPFAFGDDVSAGYLLYDLDGNGTDELLIMIGDSVYDIWTYTGDKAVHAYACPYRGEIFLHEGGILVELFGSMHAASTKVLKLDAVTGMALPAAQYAYDPSSDTREDDTWHIYAAEYDYAALTEEYRETGVFPEWAYQWRDISEEEFESYMPSDDTDIILPEPIPITSLRQ